MGVLTPLYSRKLNLGNIDGVVAVFQAVANNDTFETGLSLVEHVSVENMDVFATVVAQLPISGAGGKIVFNVVGGTPTVSIIAYGFN